MNKADAYSLESCRELATRMLYELDDHLNARPGSVQDDCVRHAALCARRGTYGSLTTGAAIKSARIGGLALTVYAEQGQRLTIRSRAEALRYLNGPVSEALYNRYYRTLKKTLDAAGLLAVFRDYRRDRRHLPKLDNFIKIVRLAGFLSPHWTKPEN